MKSNSLSRRNTASRTISSSLNFTCPGQRRHFGAANAFVVDGRWISNSFWNFYNPITASRKSSGHSASNFTRRPERGCRNPNTRACSIWRGATKPDCSSKRAFCFFPHKCHRRPEENRDAENERESDACVPCATGPQPALILSAARGLCNSSTLRVHFDHSHVFALNRMAGGRECRRAPGSHRHIRWRCKSLLLRVGQIAPPVSCGPSHFWRRPDSRSCLCRGDARCPAALRPRFHSVDRGNDSGAH